MSNSLLGKRQNPEEPIQLPMKKKMQSRINVDVLRQEIDNNNRQREENLKIDSLRQPVMLPVTQQLSTTMTSNNVDVNLDDIIYTYLEFLKNKELSDVKYGKSNNLFDDLQQVSKTLYNEYSNDILLLKNSERIIKMLEEKHVVLKNAYSYYCSYKDCLKKISEQSNEIEIDNRMNLCKESNVEKNANNLTNDETKLFFSYVQLQNKKMEFYCKYQIELIDFDYPNFRYEYLLKLIIKKIRLMKKNATV